MRLSILALCAAMTTSAFAAQVVGHNCAALWDTGTAAVSGPHLDCTDGDPTCDTDGDGTNHSCAVALNACVGTATGCTAAPLTSIKFGQPVLKKLTGFVPPAVGGAACGTAGTITIPLRSKKHGTVFKPSRPVRLLMRGKPKNLKDTVLVRCLPCTGPNCGVSTPTSCTPGQKELILTVPLEDPANPTAGNGSDLDNGWTGTSHNFPVIGGSSLHYCLNCAADGSCQGSAPTGAGTPNTAFFGAPLPLLAANVPVCVVNAFVDPTLSATYNLNTGEGGTAQNPTNIHLTSSVYLRTTFPEVCPKCSGSGIGATGTCSNTAKNAGANCTVNGEVTVAGKGKYELSSDCTPLGDSPPTPLDIKLAFSTGDASPLTGPKPCTGQTQDDSCGAGTCTAVCTGGACNGHDAAGNCIDAKGGISQLCCSGSTSTPCFPTKCGGSITRTGSPGLPGGKMLQATTFCIDATNSPVINSVTGLPGPGALLLPADVVLK